MLISHKISWPVCPVFFFKTASGRGRVADIDVIKNSKIPEDLPFLSYVPLTKQDSNLA